MTEHEERDRAAKALRRERQKAELIRRGKYVPASAERLEAAITPAMEHLTRDQVREIVQASVYAFRSGVAIHPDEFEQMMDKKYGK